MPCVHRFSIRLPLHGGGDDDDDDDDDWQVSTLLWWLAGRRIRRGRPPTIVELYTREGVEKINRAEVGLWEAVFGVRRVQTLKQARETRPMGESKETVR